MSKAIIFLTYRDSYPETEDYHRNIRRDDVIDDFENLESPSDMFHHIEDMFNRMFSFPFGMIGKCMIILFNTLWNKIFGSE